MATETIQYTVLHKDNSIEIREYNDILLASTKTSPDNQLDSGFGRVFNYISGQNDANVKINMTSPVVSYEEEGKRITGFYVPSKYDKHTVPKPKGDVYIDTIPQAKYAVITFYGAWTQETYDKHHKQLLNYINDHKYKIQSKPIIMRYSAPYVPDHQKHNEIAYQINHT